MATSLNTVLQLDPRLATLYEIAGSLKPISIDVVCCNSIVDEYIAERAVAQKATLLR
jgi:hypothetical protein